MREIKFRGRRKNSSEWVYGAFLAIPKLCSYIYDVQPDGQATRYLVDEDTVGQYTGLKDFDGKEIYEGDVIKLGNEVYTVSWAKYSACWFVDLKNFGPSLFTQYHAGKSIVVGNIHDNPNLLEADDARN